MSLRTDEFHEYLRTLHERYTIGSRVKSLLMMVADGSQLKGPPYDELCRIFGTGSLPALAKLGKFIKWEVHQCPELFTFPMLTCPECNTPNLEIYEFPQFPTDERCNECLEGRQRISKVVGGVLTNTSAARDLPEYEEVLSALVSKLGGTDGIANMYATSISAAQDKDPGGKAVLDHCRDVLKLLSSVPKDKPDIDEMTQEQLTDFIFDKLLMHRDVRERIRERLEQADKPRLHESA